ncbi:MAG: efflux RND transporter periplasmic adaptor subunit [Acetobacteraceae bacterium]|nr:efflux RND transporter periplasmic adaptor subunit [Acetobacteraceae bacterium]
MTETIQIPRPPRDATAPRQAGTLPALPPAPARGWRRLGWLLALVVLAGAGAAGWWQFARPPVLVLAAPWRGAALEAVYATGVVEAVDSARVGTTVAARIVTLAADEGDRVRAGQVIAQLDDRQAQQRLSDAQARLVLAEQELARDETLAARAIRSQQQVQRSEQVRDAAVAAVQIAARQLEEYRIASPLDGVVMKRPVQPGETVAANATLFEIASTVALKVAADVDERDIARVHMGAKVAIRAEAFPGKAIAATVTNIRGRGDTATRTFRVEADLPPDTGMLIGMTVDVNLVVAERDGALLVPPTAVRHAPPRGGRPGAAHVFRVVDGHARLTPVELGAAGPAAIEIRAGLADGAVLVADPPAGLADGQAVVGQAPGVPHG